MTHANKEVSTALYQAFTSKKPIDFISSSFELNELEAYHTQDDLINQLKNKQKFEWFLKNGNWIQKSHT